MKTILVDLNVILDYIDKRNGYEDAEIIISNCFDKTFDGYVAAHEITTLSYFLERSVKDRGKILKIITSVLKTFTIIATDERTLGMALLSDIADYEDAVIEVSAMEKNLDYIITKNIKDFDKSRVKAILPSDFLRL